MKIFGCILGILFIITINSCKKESNPTVPILTTSAVSGITQNTATSGGIISADGGEAVTSRGVCWSTNANPTIADSKTNDGNGNGNFTSSITGILANTTYYVRAYASNILGTGYGNVISFTTLLPIVVIPDSPVTDFDGNTYKTVKIGTQIWMAENLRSTHYSDGTLVQYLEYNNDTAKVKIYGRIYTAFAAMRGAASSSSNPSGVKGVAPNGWHFPSEAEWRQLVNYLGGVDIAGGKMKAVGTTYWMAPNLGATNESGFTALPAGDRDFAMGFVGRGYSCIFVTSTQTTARESTIINLAYDITNAFFFGAHPDDAGSVRCVKD